MINILTGSEVQHQPELPLRVLTACLIWLQYGDPKEAKGYLVNKLNRLYLDFYLKCCDHVCLKLLIEINPGVIQ
ncbi:hypothetical protein VN97_g11926 [Penicillium thymicola]|uniref:Uncharacterized protein n=1 Tax=Penicillium thymicola TaxID=293382 RepID=A0AAI9T6G9_PENTH|nr:hypothetical protein VN97_g11926 [Penicillium thymicola]